MFTLLDFHQDALSEVFCGTGVPDWLVGAAMSTQASGNTFPSPLAPPFNFSAPLQHPTRDECNSINNNNFPT
jgi:hypothetical protein